MYHNQNLQIKSGAIFICDTHFNDKRRDFYNFLKLVDDGTIKTEQLFLMGDMFDLLIGEIKYTHIVNKECIELINKLSRSIEIFYFEGNHDYNLQSIFPLVTIFPLSSQPLTFNLENIKIKLSHGDVYSGLGYKLYSKLIRFGKFLKVLNFLDDLVDNKISKTIFSTQKNKKICKKLINFEQIIKEKIGFYDTTNIEIVCEGHYHQNREFVFDDVRYKNFSSYACCGTIFVIKIEEKNVNFDEVRVKIDL